MRKYRGSDDYEKIANCIQCGREFTKTKKVQKLCSATCKLERNKARNRITSKQRHQGIVRDANIEQEFDYEKWNNLARDTASKLSKRPEARPMPGR
jgi:hypothetical protein